MPFPSTHSEYASIYAKAEIVSSRIQLPFRQEKWQGTVGNWLGAGTGSSIDFQDHRPYVPGDDPRYINWQAYARSGSYSMKLYREEVSPEIDLVFDASSSMALDDEKTARSLELFYFSYASALRMGASLRCFIINGGSLLAPGIDVIRNHLWHEQLAHEEIETVPQFEKIPWRARAMKVLVTDLLYPGSPATVLPWFNRSETRGILFCPFTDEEAKPSWQGNLELIDCETNRKQLRFFSKRLLEQYKQAYREHFQLWYEFSRRNGVKLVSIPSSGELADVLSSYALKEGAVEIAI